MKVFIFDEDGTQYNFKNVNFIENNKNKNERYSVKLNTSEGEFFRITNAVAVFKELKTEKTDNNFEISLRNTKTPLILPYNSVNMKFKEETNIYCDIDTYNLVYFFKFLNYAAFPYKVDNDIIYETGYFILNDGTLLTINDIVKYETIENSKLNYKGYIVYSKEKAYAINNCISYIFYNKPQNANINNILNLIIEGNHIQLEGINRTDIEFYFSDNKNKLDYKVNNQNIDLKLIYYYRHFSSAWFSKKDNPVVNIQSNFNKSKKSNILSL